MTHEVFPCYNLTSKSNSVLTPERVSLRYEERGIPAQRFLGIDEIAEEEILNVIQTYYKTAFE